MENLTEKATFLERKSFTIDDKTLVVKFRLMGAEEENENKRVYPRPVLAKAVEELRAKLAKRKDSFALTTHKDDENVDDIAAVLEDVTMEGNDVFATARVLNSQRGRNVQAILKGGGAVGVSAKCYGSVKDGRVQPGLVLRGFDFVTAPGFGTYATASNIIESVEVPDEMDGATTLEELEKYGLEPLEPIKEEIVKQRYRFAIEAGYKGTFEQYSKDVLKKS
jgi:hypothetical protein